MGKIDDALKKFEQEKKATEAGKKSGIRRKKSRNKKQKLNLLDSKTAEVYRGLRTNIRRLTKNGAIQSILITSANQQEGRTTIAVNLALSLAEVRNERVVLIDADLRHPSVHTKLGLEQRNGLVDILEGKIDLDKALKETKLEYLKVLTNGSLLSHPAELLESQKIKDLIKELKSRFDIILFDCSPLIPFTDPIILGSEVDAVILVVRSGQTRQEVIQHAHLSLQKAKIRILGAVLNAKEYYIPERIYRRL